MQTINSTPIRKIVVAAFMVLAVTMIPAGAAFAASGSGDEGSIKAKLDLMSSFGATGEAELELRIDDDGTELRARARGEGLASDVSHTMRVSGMFIDSDEADGGRVDMDEDIPVSLTSLVGLRVTITDSFGRVVLEGTVN